MSRGSIASRLGGADAQRQYGVLYAARKGLR
jgi:hypothetical protein